MFYTLMRLPIHNNFAFSTKYVVFYVLLVCMIVLMLEALFNETVYIIRKGFI